MTRGTNLGRKTPNRSLWIAWGILTLAMFMAGVLPLLGTNASQEIMTLEPNALQEAWVRGIAIPAIGSLALLWLGALLVYLSKTKSGREASGLKLWLVLAFGIALFGLAPLIAGNNPWIVLGFIAGGWGVVAWWIFHKRMPQDRDGSSAVLIFGLMQFDWFTNKVIEGCWYAATDDVFAQYLLFFNGN